MRNIINISLPPELTKIVKKEVEAGNYASISEFFRHLLRIHNLAKELKNIRKDFPHPSGPPVRISREKMELPGRG